MRGWLGRAWAWWEDFDARHGHATMLICVIIAALSASGWLIQQTVNAAAAEQRQADLAAQQHRNTNLLGCVSDWADDFTGTITPIRSATVARDEAQLRRDADLANFSAVFGAVLEKNLRGVTIEPVELETLRSVTSDLRASASTLAVRQARLARVRVANPYPRAPRFSCAVDARGAAREAEVAASVPVAGSARQHRHVARRGPVRARGGCDGEPPGRGLHRPGREPLHRQWGQALSFRVSGFDGDPEGPETPS